MNIMASFLALKRTRLRQRMYYLTAMQIGWDKSEYGQILNGQEHY